MTKENFDQFKNDVLKLSQEAGALWEQYTELKTSNDMVIRLAKKQKCQIDLMAEDRQKTNDEIKIIKLELRKAREKIKELENEKLNSTVTAKSKGTAMVEPDMEENSFSADNTLDLELLVSDFDTKLAIKEEEQSFNYLKKMDLDL